MRPNKIQIAKKGKDLSKKIVEWRDWMAVPDNEYAIKGKIGTMILTEKTSNESLRRAGEYIHPHLRPDYIPNELYYSEEYQNKVRLFRDSFLEFN
jgi:hypothetical protein